MKNSIQCFTGEKKGSCVWDGEKVVVLGSKAWCGWRSWIELYGAHSSPVCLVSGRVKVWQSSFLTNRWDPPGHAAMFPSLLSSVACCLCPKGCLRCYIAASRRSTVVVGNVLCAWPGLNSSGDGRVCMLRSVTTISAWKFRLPFVLRLHPHIVNCRREIVSPCIIMPAGKFSIAW